MTLRTRNYGNYGIFLIMGNAGFCPSTVCLEMLGYRGKSDLVSTSWQVRVLHKAARCSGEVRTTRFARVALTPNP